MRFRELKEKRCKELKVSVTKKDIDNRDLDLFLNTLNPIEFAICRLIGKMKVHVEADIYHYGMFNEHYEGFIYFYPVEKFTSALLRFLMPRSVCQILIRWRNGKEIKPFRFIAKRDLIY